jgi:hypothetical protein
VSLEISNMMWAVVNFVCWTSQSVAVWDINTVIFFYDSLFACDSSDGFSLLKENMAYIITSFLFTNATS